MKQVELEEIIQKATKNMMMTLEREKPKWNTQKMRLDLSRHQLSFVSDILDDILESLKGLVELNLGCNKLGVIPKNLCNLINLSNLNLESNQFSSLPDGLGELVELTQLNLEFNNLQIFPEILCNLKNLTTLNLGFNQLKILPETIGNLTKLNELFLDGNQLATLPGNLVNLTDLTWIHLDDNPLTDLSILQELPELQKVMFLYVDLPRRYWVKFSDWKTEWLLDEDNAEIRRIVIEQLGYEKICEELNAINLDTWKEYTLLKIDGVEAVYDEYEAPIDREPMVLLKMTCPSTEHIHILRVPPEMVSAEAAITWVNHGIHPDEFAVQT
jgi:leucine-rich repeat protein SHOC2